MMTSAPPTADAQLLFLSKLQRLFAEGSFAATYKYALLIALADLAVERGADDGRELVLTTRQLGERFIQLYWHQSTPYGTDRADTFPDILLQNFGVQAGVISLIAVFLAQASIGSLQAVRVLPAFQPLLAQVSAIVSAQPLKFLQNFGGSTDEFLYERVGPGRIQLKPGVGYCLRRFQPLVQQLARSHWVGHIKGNHRNQKMLGNVDDLEDFLFRASRKSLTLLVAGLRKIDGGGCFYCDRKLDATEATDVDHFIPFSHYPRDLAHNFVLAHPNCNRSKSDSLAARPHLERWLVRMQRSVDDITEIGIAAGMLADAHSSIKIASWDYASAVQGGAKAWLAARHYGTIDRSYDTLFIV